MTSTKNRQRFVELAEKRVTRAIKDLRLIGNLANRSNYSYSQKDSNAILKALNREIRDLKVRFEGGGKNGEPGFKLPREIS